MNTTNQKISRRSFLKTATEASAGISVPWALNLAAIGEAAAATATDYKALVCVYLQGGCDYANTLVTYDQPSYDKYLAIRGAKLSLPRSALTNSVLNPVAGADLVGGRQYALAPTMSDLVPLFNNSNKKYINPPLACVLNIGTLVKPTSLAQYKAGIQLPPKLMSHVDQQTYWQSSKPAALAFTGWGGRLVDNYASSSFSCINVSGNYAPIAAGISANQYTVNATGLVGINVFNSPYGVGGSAACTAALKTLLTQAPSRSHWLEAEYGRIANRTISSYSVLAGSLMSDAALNAVPGFPVFPANNSLADQLKMVARIIASSQSLGVKRQVFYVQLGGFDLHDGLMNHPHENHATLVGKVARAMASFYAATESLGVAKQVTTFTASEFGRSLRGNTDGSDHGWGGHHFVMGGAVKGGKFYGDPPEVADGGPDDIGQGRLLPKISVEQYAATMGRWFGADAATLNSILPKLVNFAPQTDLGFL